GDDQRFSPSSGGVGVRQGGRRGGVCLGPRGGRWEAEVPAGNRPSRRGGPGGKGAGQPGATPGGVVPGVEMMSAGGGDEGGGQRRSGSSGSGGAGSEGASGGPRRVEWSGGQGPGGRPSHDRNKL